MKRYSLLIVVILGFGIAHTAVAVPIVSTGAGTAVSVVDHQATFDGVVGGTNLLGYTEDNLVISVNDSHCCFDQAHYGAGGNFDFVTITTVDDAVMAGVEAIVGWGFTTQTTGNVIWETRLDGIVTGGGVFTKTFFSSLPSNTVNGWADVSGFDELRLAAHPTNTTLGAYQAIALDNVRVQLLATVPVPEPGTVTLLGIAMLGLGARRRRAYA